MPIKFRSKPSLQAKVNYAPAKRQLPKWQWYGLALVLLSPLFYFIIKFLISAILITANGFITTDSVVIRAPADGYIYRISVKTGEPVAENVGLVWLESPILATQQAHISKQLTDANAKLHATDNTELESLLIKKQTAEQHLAQTQAYYQKLSKLTQQGLVTIVDLHRAEVDYQNSEMQLNEINHQIAKNQNDFKLNVITPQRQKIASLQQQLAELEVNQGLLQISAPAAGTVIAIHNQAHEYVSKGQEIMAIATNEAYYVKALLDAKYTSKIKVGDSVKILLPDHQLLSGVVAQAPGFTQKTETSLVNNNNPYTVVIKITPQDPIPKQYQIYNLPVTVVF
jgi:multidrug resistance efflux pump